MTENIVQNIQCIINGLLKQRMLCHNRGRNCKEKKDEEQIVQWASFV